MRTFLIPLAFAACGGEERASAPATPTPTPTLTAQATATSSPTPTPTPTPRPAPADEGGDEAGNRVPVELELGAGEIRPGRVEVPAFLGLRLEVANQSGSERILRLDGEVVLELLPGDDGSAEVEGLQPGEHVLEAGASGRVVIVAQRAGEEEAETGGAVAPSP